MKLRNVPALALAAILQIAPLARIATLAPTVPVTSVAVIFQWLTGAAILLGGYDAISAPSAAITGFAPIDPATFKLLGPVSTNGTATVGTSSAYRIVVSNPGVNTNLAYYGASSLPPGLTINTNFGGNGVISGTPSAAGFFPALLWAGNKNSTNIVYKNVNFTVSGGSVSPPTITSNPTNVIARTGANISLSVAASGSGLQFQWYFGTNIVTGGTATTLTLTNVAASQSGNYYASVSNTSGTNHSSTARVLIVPAPGNSQAGSIGFGTATPNQLSMSFQTVAGYHYILQSLDDLSTTNWVTVTNIPAGFDPGMVNLSAALGDAPQRYYRLAVGAGL